MADFRAEQNLEDERGFVRKRLKILPSALEIYFWSIEVSVFEINPRNGKKVRASETSHNFAEGEKL